MKETTYFGYEEIPREEKSGRVRGVFDSVASRYDVMNDAMSFGMHRVWKREFINRISPREDMKILDLAGGTGDIALGIRNRFAHSAVSVCDINLNMLHEGRNRALNKNIIGLEWVCGNAESLPFANHYFHSVTMAFGIRNVTDISAALKDIYRVLKHGGQFLCLEFSPVSDVSHPLFHTLYDVYSFHVIPWMGKMLAGESASYNYLVESIRKFPPAPQFEAMIKESGFENTSHSLLAGGAVAIHTGWRL